MCVHVYSLNGYTTYLVLVDVNTGERLEGRPRAPSFSEQQAKYAKTAIEESLDLGDKLFECTQGAFLHAYARLLKLIWPQRKSSFRGTTTAKQGASTLRSHDQHTDSDLTLLDGSMRVSRWLWLLDSLFHVP